MRIRRLVTGNAKRANGTRPRLLFRCHPTIAVPRLRGGSNSPTAAASASRPLLMSCQRIALAAYTSLWDIRGAQGLDRMTEERGMPKTVLSDLG
jgi:hypothetical protein